MENINKNKNTKSDSIITYTKYSSEDLKKTFNTLDSKDNENSEELIDIDVFREKKDFKFKKIFSIVVIVVVILLGSAFVSLNANNVSLFHVTGNSMYPTLKDGDNIVMKYKREIERDDIVVSRAPTRWAAFTHEKFDNPNYKKPLLIKRAVAIPGDNLKINKKGVFVNDNNILDFDKEGYQCKRIKDSAENKVYEYIIPQNLIFTLGDNYKNSVDSLFIFCNSTNQSITDGYEDDSSLLDESHHAEENKKDYYEKQESYKTEDEIEEETKRMSLEKRAFVSKVDVVQYGEILKKF